jgi:hypothetical protein
MPHCSSAHINSIRNAVWGICARQGSPGPGGAGWPGILPSAALGLLLAAAITAMGGQRVRAEGATAPPGHGGGAAAALGEPLNPSTPEQEALAAQLRRQGAQFYGAWWCPACFQQKNLFGKEGSRQLPYVECDKTEADRDRCTAAKIQAYPTWVLKGQRLEGVQRLYELKRWADEVGRPEPTSASGAPKAMRTSN